MKKRIIHSKKREGHVKLLLQNDLIFPTSMLAHLQSPYSFMFGTYSDLLMYFSNETIFHDMYLYLCYIRTTNPYKFPCVSGVNSCILCRNQH